MLLTLSNKLSMHLNNSSCLFACCAIGDTFYTAIASTTNTLIVTKYTIDGDTLTTPIPLTISGGSGAIKNIISDGTYLFIAHDTYYISVIELSTFTYKTTFMADGNGISFIYNDTLGFVHYITTQSNKIYHNICKYQNSTLSFVSRVLLGDAVMNIGNSMIINGNNIIIATVGSAGLNYPIILSLYSWDGIEYTLLSSYTTEICALIHECVGIAMHNNKIILYARKAGVGVWFINAYPIVGNIINSCTQTVIPGNKALYIKSDGTFLYCLLFTNVLAVYRLTDTVFELEESFGCIHNHIDQDIYNGQLSISNNKIFFVDATGNTINMFRWVVKAQFSADKISGSVPLTVNFGAI